MPKAQCRKIKYEAGSFELTQGVKGGSDGKWEGGRFFESRGHGWVQNIRSSKLILYVLVEKKPFEIWIDRFFKNNFGRLTKKRRDLIAKTMPESVEIEEQTSPRGTKYCTVSEADLQAWLARAKAAQDS